MVSQDVIDLTKEAGFDDCLHSPLKVSDVESIIHNRLSSFAIDFICSKFEFMLRHSSQFKDFQEILS
jgi:hypothetical protein